MFITVLYDDVLITSCLIYAHIKYEATNSNLLVYIPTIFTTVGILCIILYNLLFPCNISKKKFLFSLITYFSFFKLINAFT